MGGSRITHADSGKTWNHMRQRVDPLLNQHKWNHTTPLIIHPPISDPTPAICTRIKRTTVLPSFWHMRAGMIPSAPTVNINGLLWLCSPDSDVPTGPRMLHKTVFVLFVDSCPETEAVYSSLALFAFAPAVHYLHIIPSLMHTVLLNANSPFPAFISISLRALRVMQFCKDRFY